MVSFSNTFRFAGYGLDGPFWGLDDFYFWAEEVERFCPAKGIHNHKVIHRSEFSDSLSMFDDFDSDFLNIFKMGS